MRNGEYLGGDIKEIEHGVECPAVAIVSRLDGGFLSAMRPSFRLPLSEMKHIGLRGLNGAAFGT
jgi:hypothetical protein